MILSECATRMEPGMEPGMYCTEYVLVLPATSGVEGRP